jgi:serine/threonine protein kinase
MLRFLVHRDVKMQNILLKDNYQTLGLTDYGTATQLGKSWMTDNVGTPSNVLSFLMKEIFNM